MKTAKKLLILFLSHTLLASTHAQTADTATVSSTPADRLADGNWKNRWESQLKAIDEAKRTRLIFLGDSITQGWDGQGKAVWDDEYERYHPINFGIGGDRTEHLLWRIRHADLKKLKPKVAVIMIGTNNTGHNQRDPEDTADGIKTILSDLREAWPDTQLLLLAIFPRGETPDDKLRKLNTSINELIAKFDDGKHIHFLDINPELLGENGVLSKDIMPDLLHPNAKGYQIWAKAMKPTLKKLGL